MPSVSSLLAAARQPDTVAKVRISKAEAKEIVAVATPADVNVIAGLTANEMTPAARKVIQAFLANAGTTPTTPSTPTAPVQDVKLEFRSPKKVWTTTYWPMCGSLSNPNGDPNEHLWATGGCLDKLDQLLKALGKPTGALAYEKRPYFTWLVGSDQDAGYYIPAGTIREDDAERTTGVDLDGDGKIKANVKHDFMAGSELLGEKDGKTNGSYDASWFGICDLVTLAGQLFEEPKQPVTYKGVTFTPQDIKGLACLAAAAHRGTDFVGCRYNGNPDVVRLTDGTQLRGFIQGMGLEEFRSGNFRTSGNQVTRLDYDKEITIQLLDGTTQKIPVEKQAAIVRESDEDSPAEMHNTLKRWGKDARPFGADHDSGSHVWNDSFDGINMLESATVPPGVMVNKLNGVSGPYKGGKLTFCTTQWLQDTYVAKSYRYWIEEKNGKVVNSGWLGGKPDFLHRPSSGTFDAKAKNPRNPFVDGAVVMELVKASTGAGPATIA